MLLLFVPAAVLAGFVAWLFRPVSLDVRVTIEPYSFMRYDDYAGHLGLCAMVEITNNSDSTVWFSGYNRVPSLLDEQLISGEWKRHMSFNANTEGGTGPWEPLRSMESITVVASPISESANELRVCVQFINRAIGPSDVYWVYSPVSEIKQVGDYYFPETKHGSEQEIQVVPYKKDSR